jgi:transcriptional regulator with XRE-family HTH domain
MSEAKRLPVGGRVRWARARKNLSHDSLALQVASTRSYLIRVEKGMHMPGPELRARIAVATDQPADFFKDGESEDDEEEDELVRELVGVLRRLVSYETRAVA